MESYENRLQTFEFWSGREDRQKLALVGFYYTGHNDTIVCYYCKLDLYNFTAGDEDSLRDHKRYSPDCPFFVANTTKYVNTRFVSPRTFRSNYLSLAPHFGDYRLFEHRVNSFVNYPLCLRSLVSDMCEAGFYYTNVGDAVCCYVCDVVAKDWTPHSDAWTVHVEMNERCPLVYLRKKLAHSNNDPTVPTPTAPPYVVDVRRELPKCMICKTKVVDAVLVPCFHLCACQDCAVASVRCVSCDLFCGGFFAVKIPQDTLKSQHETVERGISEEESFHGQRIEERERVKR